jgi:hypothetical protein
MTPKLPLTTHHRRRLRQMWRSAGWPFLDVIEAELLAAGLLERVRDGGGRETLRVTDAGIAVIAATTQSNRAIRNAHQELIGRLAHEMQRAVRIVWRGLSLHASPACETKSWPMAMPDVFSIRHTDAEDYFEPIVHEIKLNRADRSCPCALKSGDECTHPAGAIWFFTVHKIHFSNSAMPCKKANIALSKKVFCAPADAET